MVANIGRSSAIRPDIERAEMRDLARLRREGVKWVIVSGDVTDRVLAARDRYPREAQFYDELQRSPKPAFVVLPAEPGLAGPWVRVYRL